MKTTTKSIVFIPTLSFWLFLTGCGNAAKDYELDAKSFTAQHLKMVEEKTGIKMPAGSRGLNLYYDASHSIDASFIAKIEIPITSIDSITKQLEEKPVKDGGMTSMLRNKATWWNPSETTIRIKRLFTYAPTGGAGEILFCEESGHWILYINWVVS